MSSEISPHDVVGTTCWLILSGGATKDEGAKTVTGGLDLARGAGNRGNLGRAIP